MGDIIILGKDIINLITNWIYTIHPIITGMTQKSDFDLKVNTSYQFYFYSNVIIC